MKGLLYKEFILGRKNYLAFLALAFVCALLGVLVCLSMICGNLQSVPTEDPEGVKVFNPAFDVTDNDLIAGIVTEFGVARAPYTESLKEIFKKKEDAKK